MCYLGCDQSGQREYALSMPSFGKVGFGKGRVTFQDGRQWGLGSSLDVGTGYGQMLMSWDRRLSSATVDSGG